MAFSCSRLDKQCRSSSSKVINAQDDCVEAVTYASPDAGSEAMQGNTGGAHHDGKLALLSLVIRRFTTTNYKECKQANMICWSASADLRNREDDELVII